MGAIWGREPVLYLSIVKAAVVLLVAFGLELSTEQVAAVFLATEAVLAFVARGRVTPVAAVAASGPAVPMWHGPGADESGGGRAA